MDIVHYFFAAFSVFLINALPALMPPTWMVLVFFLATYNLNPVAMVIIGALFALSGRLVLYYLASKFRGVLPKRMDKNYQDLGKFLSEHKAISLPLFLLFAFYPLPSNQLFIVAGLAKVKPKLLAMSFLGGRLLSYSFWVGGAHVIDRRLEMIFRDGLDPRSVVVALLSAIFLIALPGFLPWKKIHQALFKDV